jgi:protease-4
MSVSPWIVTTEVMVSEGAVLRLAPGEVVIERAPDTRHGSKAFPSRPEATSCRPARYAAHVIGLLLRLVLLVGWILALPVLLVRRIGSRVPRGTYLLVEIDGALDEAPPAPRWQPWGGPRPFSLHRLRALVDRVAGDPRVRGLLLVVKSMRGGFASATSLRGAVASARAAGKRVVVHLPLGGGTKEAYVAVAADRAMLGPQAVLAPVGVLSRTRYVRGALDRAGIVPVVHARGKYKTAAEAIERTTMSDAQREQVGAILDGLHGELVRAIAQGRDVDETRAKAIVDGAPYVGAEAVGAGLVDAVAYEDEIPERMAKAGSKPTIRYAGPYLAAREALRPRALRSAGAIAVVRVHGAITGSVGIGFALGRIAVDERVISAVRAVRANPYVRGVVLHIDSPGGSALASDRIHHEIAQLAAVKPLVACMGDVAASGGYYVAAPAHEIVAQPTTVTGSIGVVTARAVLEPLLARLGIATEVIARGEHARLLDPLLPLDDGDARAIDREIERMYGAFVAVVALGRKRSVEEVERVAQGRVWTGADALGCGLVDRMGGFEDALEALRERIGRGAGRLRVVVVRPPSRPFPVLDPPQRKVSRALGELADPLFRAVGIDVGLLALALARERVLAWSAVAAIEA